MAFRFCVFTLASDGIQAKYGTPFTPLQPLLAVERRRRRRAASRPAYMEDGEAVTALETALHGLYNQDRFLQLHAQSSPRSTRAPDGLSKRIAKPHQYFAVTKAVGSTIQAVEQQRQGRRRLAHPGLGQVHGDGALHQPGGPAAPSCKNPTVVVITDRNELDGQLFEGFDRQPAAARERPSRSSRRSELRDELSNRTTGGIYFTTLQKFGRSKTEKDAGADHPLLSDRRNIIVVVDEAHRSHYDDLDGYARHLRDALPHATLIAFTGTPISFDDRNTQDVFGDYIDIYDLSRAVDDGATVPVYFEPRLIKVGLAYGRHRGDPRRRPPTRPPLGLDDAERAAHRAERRRRQRRLRRAAAARGARRGPGGALGEPARSGWAVHRGAGQGDDRRRHAGDLREAVRRRSSSCGPTGTPTTSTRAGSRSSTPATASDAAAGLRPRAPGLAERDDQGAAQGRRRRAGDS